MLLLNSGCSLPDRTHCGHVGDPTGQHRLSNAVNLGYGQGNPCWPSRGSVGMDSPFREPDWVAQNDVLP